MKKLIVIATLAILLIILSPKIIAVLIVSHGYDNLDSDMMKNFSKYDKDFENISTRILDLSKQYADVDVRIWINYQTDEQNFTIGENEIKLTQDEKNGLKTLKMRVVQRY